MRKNTDKKALALFLAGVLSLGLVACSSGGQTSGSSSLKSSESEGSKAKDTQGSELEDIKPRDPDEIPIFTEDGSWTEDKDKPTTIDWLVAYDWANVGFDPDNNIFDKWVLDNTGVTINFQIGNQEKLSVLMATNELPDMVTYDVMSSERKNLENKGLLLPLDDLTKQYARDLCASESMKKWYANDKDGHWYSYVSYFYDVKECEERGIGIETHNMNFARKDIMKALNIDPDSMTTKDGFIAALQKVKDSNYEYNGQRVIPYINTNITYLAEQFGLDYETPQGDLVNIQKQPEYLEALLFMNEIYNKGLTTDEIFTMDDSMRRQLVTSGQIFAGTQHSYLAGKEDLYYTDNDALMMGVGLIKGDGGKDPYISPSPTGGWAATMITANCKEPERAVKLLSFLSQPECSLSYYYGGLDGYDIKDHQAFIKAERDELRSEDPQAFDAKYRNYIQDILCDYSWIKLYEPQEGLDGFRQDQKEYTQKWVTGRIFDDKIFNDVNPDYGTDLAATQQQINDYWEQQLPQIVMAGSQEEAKSIFESTLAEMDNMGMKDLEKFRNERFHANKEKMDIELAWPRNNEK